MKTPSCIEVYGSCEGCPICKTEQFNGDMLSDLFEMQTLFMERLKAVDPSEVPDWPINLSDKKAQRSCRDFALRATEELFEAILMLKKWKGHRVIDQPTVDRQAFLEEIVDSMHYIIEVMILTGVDAGQLHDAFVRKHLINMDRVAALEEANNL